MYGDCSTPTIATVIVFVTRGVAKANRHPFGLSWSWSPGRGRFDNTSRDLISASVYGEVHLLQRTKCTYTIHPLGPKYAKLLPLLRYSTKKKRDFQGAEAATRIRSLPGSSVLAYHFEILNELKFILGERRRGVHSCSWKAFCTLRWGTEAMAKGQIGRLSRPIS